MKNLLLVNNSKQRMPRQAISRALSKCFRELLLTRENHPELSRGQVPLKSRLQDQLVVVFLDPGPARKINFQFRKKNYATDVLSFQSGRGLGELVLCPNVLQKQAKTQGHSFERELIYMLIHGVLHLLGFDHEQGAAKAQRMMQFQELLFQTIIDKKSSGT